MINAEKWSFEKHKYEPCQISENASLPRENFEDLVDCAECGKQIKFGDSYTSLRIQTSIGLGYAVCEDCYEKEWEERRKYKDGYICLLRLR